MLATDRAKFATLFGQVMAYYRQDVSDFTRDLFWNAFEGCDYETVRKAFEKHAKDPEQGRFAPKVADLIKIIAGTHTDRAAMAWGKVHDAMSRVGAYTDVIFDDPAIHAAIDDIGGWPKTCRTDLNELNFLQKRFMDAHKVYSNRGQFEYPRRLIGDRSEDAEYERIGMKPPAPTLIGDQEKCRDVFRLGVAGGRTAIGVADRALLALENKT